MAKVVVYSSDSCTYCKQAKEFLKANNIEYVEKNVSTDLEARKELMAKGHMVGFNKAELSKALGL